MKNILKEIFNFENFKLGVLMSGLSNNPDTVVISHLKDKMYQSNDVSKTIDDEEAA